MTSRKTLRYCFQVLSLIIFGFFILLMGGNSIWAQKVNIDYDAPLPMDNTRAAIVIPQFVFNASTYFTTITNAFGSKGLNVRVPGYVGATSAQEKVMIQDVLNRRLVSQDPVTYENNLDQITQIYQKAAGGNGLTKIEKLALSYYVQSRMVVDAGWVPYSIPSRK